MMGGGMDISQVIAGARGDDKSKDETTEWDNEDKWEERGKRGAVPDFRANSAATSALARVIGGDGSL